MSLNTTNTNANPPKIYVILIKFLLLISFSLRSIKLDTSMELKNIATINDDPRIADNVIGKKIMNSPIIPGHPPRGINAAIVVAVDTIIGIATSPTPAFAA